MQDGIGERVKELGLIVVEGPNDVIALDALSIPAVGLCSNTVTSEQVGKLARYAEEVGSGIVTLMLDCDPEGEAGARQALVELAQHCPVRLAWSPSMHGGVFTGRQPESLRPEEWGILAKCLTRRDLASSTENGQGSLAL